MMEILCHDTEQNSNIGVCQVREVCVNSDKPCHVNPQIHICSYNVSTRNIKKEDF